MSFKSAMKATGKFIAKNSHWFLTGIGTVAVAVGSVDLARTVQSKKFQKNMEKAKNLILDIDRDENGKAKVKDIVPAYTKSIATRVKAYARPALIITAGTACIVSAVFIQSRRLKQMAALYTATVAAYEAYRSRVRAEVGEQKEFDLFNDIKRDENGNIITVKGESPDGLLGYRGSESTTVFTRIIGPECPIWQKNTRYMFNRIRAIEEEIGTQLKLEAISNPNHESIIYMNDIYDKLMLPRSEEGMKYGIYFKLDDPTTSPNIRFLEDQFGGQEGLDAVVADESLWGRTLCIDFKPNFFNEHPYSLEAKDAHEAAVIRLEALKTMPDKPYVEYRCDFNPDR